MPVLLVLALIVVPQLLFSRRTMDVAAWVVTLGFTAPAVGLSATCLGWGAAAASGHVLPFTQCLLYFGLPAAGLVSYLSLAD